MKNESKSVFFFFFIVLITWKSNIRSLLRLKVSCLSSVDFMTSSAHEFKGTHTLEELHTHQSTSFARFLNT